MACFLDLSCLSFTHRSVVGNLLHSAQVLQTQRCTRSLANHFFCSVSDLKVFMSKVFLSSLLLLLPCIVHKRRLWEQWERLLSLIHLRHQARLNPSCLYHTCTSGGETQKAMQDFLSEAKAVQVLLLKAGEKLEHFSIQEAENTKSQRAPPRRTD